MDQIEFGLCQGLALDWCEFRPPRRLRTIPYRALVPRLLRQMVLRNDPKMALDWLGLALDWLGLTGFGNLENSF